MCDRDGTSIVWPLPNGQRQAFRVYTILRDVKKLSRPRMKWTEKGGRTGDIPDGRPLRLLLFLRCLQYTVSILRTKHRDTHESSGFGRKGKGLKYWKESQKSSLFHRGKKGEMDSFCLRYDMSPTWGLFILFLFSVFFCEERLLLDRYTEWPTKQKWHFSSKLRVKK